MAFKFTVKQKTVKLTDVNPREEFHGEEKKIAMDLTFVAGFDGSDLKMFAPDLRDAWFKVDDKPDIDAQGKPGEPLKLRHQHIKTPYSWGEEMVNQDVTIEFGVSGRDIQISDAKVSKFKLTPNDGGTVTIQFAVQSLANEAWATRVVMLLGSDVTLTILTPKHLRATKDAKE